MTKRLAALLAALAACGSPPGPIGPATLPEPAFSYDDADTGRSFAAPARGTLRWNGDDAEVVYGGRAKLTVSAIAGGGPISEASVERALHRIPTLDGSKLLREESPGVGIFCMESAPPSRVAACARLDEESRRGGGIVLTTFIADAPTYAAMGGARAPAEAARTAKGFRAPAPLPPP